MQNGQEFCLIEDPHQASLFFLAATLSVSVFLSHAIMIWCDNVSALAIASNPVLLTRKKEYRSLTSTISENVLSTKTSK